MKKYLITYNHGAGRQVVTCSNKREANKIAKEASKLLNWSSDGWTIKEWKPKK